MNFQEREEIVGWLNNEGVFATKDGTKLLIKTRVNGKAVAMTIDCGYIRTALAAADRKRETYTEAPVMKTKTRKKA